MKTDPVTPSKQYPSGLKLATILLSLALGTLLVAIDTTIISVAIPKIATEFTSIDDVGWYGSAYLLTLTALQPAAGTMFKLFNAKAVYLTSMTIFEGRYHKLSHEPQSWLIAVISWLGRVCFFASIIRVHCRQSYCRHWCCRCDSRSPQYSNICCSNGQKACLHRSHCQYVWDIFLHQPDSWRCFHGSHFLEMVFLDVCFKTDTL